MKRLAHMLIAVAFCVVLLGAGSLALGVGASAPAVPANSPCTPGTGYNPRCDVDHDGDIDVTDIQLTAGRWNYTGTWSIEPHDHDDRYWKLTGNSSTNPSSNFLGTTDAATLTLAVSGTTALRLAPTGGTPNVIGGYGGNSVGSGVVGATIAGGGTSSFPNQATEDYATVGGGAQNVASGYAAVVGGGAGNIANGVWAVVGGGHNNVAGEVAVVAGGSDNTASNGFAAVGGGYNNIASGTNATVGGGLDNTASGTSATVGGGWHNMASGTDATVGGGSHNNASGWYATVAGGAFITVTADYAAVGGGQYNLIAATYGTIAGGFQNVVTATNATVGGGHSNMASGNYATVGGGYSNMASGRHATVPGGEGNEAAGSYSLAAGRRAHALSDGTFVWNGDMSNHLYSRRLGQFIVRAPGGFWFGNPTDDITPTIGAGVFISTSTGAYLSTGGTWTDASDRNAKENFQPVDPQAVLEQVAQLPITTWNYKAEDDTLRHMGPTAQDFYVIFGLGQDDKHIAALDANGVALTAIQALYAHNQALEAENAELRARVDGLEAKNAAQQAQLDELQGRIEALEALARRGTFPFGLLGGSAGMFGMLLLVGLMWTRRRQV